MKHTPSYAAERRDAHVLSKVLVWSLIAAFGATIATSLMVKALALTLPKATAAATAVASVAPTPPAPSPSSNPAPVLAATMAHSCAACHGTNGELGDEYFMPLAGMPVAQFVSTMTDFREGKRPATLMGHVARGFTDADIKAMGEFFGAVKTAASTAPKGAQ